MVMMFSSSPPPFFQIPTLVIKPRNQQLLWKAPPFYQTTLQPSLFTSVYLPSPLRTKLQKCFLQRQSKSDQEQVFEFERLFSNLNQATLKREPGSLSSAVLLVAGTTVFCSFSLLPIFVFLPGISSMLLDCDI